MRGWLCESCKREVGEDLMIECSPGWRFQASVHKNTLRVPILLCQSGEGRGHLTRVLVAVEPHRPPMTNVGTETAFRLDHCKNFLKK